MTKEEAIIALGEGNKVRHRYFTYDEYVYVGEGNYLYDECGNVRGEDFWDVRDGIHWSDGWSIVGEERKGGN